MPNVIIQITNGANAGNASTTDGIGNYSIRGITPDTFTLSAALAPSCTFPPGPPGFLGWSSLSSGSVRISWSAATGIVTSYVIEIGTTTGGSDVGIIDTGSATPVSYQTATRQVTVSVDTRVDFALQRAAPTPESTYTFTGLRTSVDFYRVRVRAKNPCGVSGPSNEANPRIP